MINCTGIWLKKGTTDKVRTKTLQYDLNDKGITKLAINGSLATDGDFGGITEKVVLYAQEKVLKTTKDGIVGPVTCKLLNEYKATSTTGWTRIWYTRDSQDTNYTCGPSSLKMALSVYGLYYNEGTLAVMVKANPSSGTEIENIVNAVNNLGKGLTARNETFKDWNTLEGYLRKGWPVMLRVASWWTPGGQHYVVLVGINQQTGQVELGDPSNGGFRSTTMTDLLNRIKQVSVPSVIVIMK